MPFTRHLVLTQTLIGSLEDALGVQGSHVFVDKPLRQQVDISDVGMVKFTLFLERNIGQEIDPTQLSSRMSLNQMASELETQLMRSPLLATA